jgi:hypothetical protein
VEVEHVDTWHNGLNRGTTPVKFLVVYAAEEGKSTAVRPLTHAATIRSHSSAADRATNATSGSSPML